MHPRLRDYEAPAREILEKMSIREKATFAVGKEMWILHGNEKYGLPELFVTDGPHGLRKTADSVTDVSGTVPSTAFPTGSASACSFDPELLYEMGQAMGEECIKEDTAVILGPGVNHKRSPLCGRNFEYYSEDPLLAGKIGAGLVNGIEDKGIGTASKHFACNNQELARMNNDSIVDERALHEIYLRQFETIVKEADPSGIMTSYNRINGVFSSDSKEIMTDAARELWDYRGIFVTDWLAVNHLQEGYVNGLDLEMPGVAQDRIKAVTDGVLDGTVPIETVDASALRMIELILRAKDAFAGKFNDGKTGAAAADMEAHLAVARKVAESSAVLLKNDDAILPLKPDQKIAVFGNFAEKPRYQGAGSSQLIPYKLVTPLEAFRTAGIPVQYAEGYGCEETKPDETKLAAAERLAKDADLCIVFAGLPGSYESEGFDRTKLDMPDSHNQLIRRVAAVNPNTVVVLQIGSPVLMPWLDDVKGVLCAYLAGSDNGTAIVDLLTGQANPSGRLAETFPLRLEDNPSYGEYCNDPYFTIYKESIFTGYRYYDTAGKEVLFPFGYGLSYTTFSYDSLKVEKVSDGAAPLVKVSVDVTNTGSVPGKEVVQVYVGQNDPVIFKAKKELKAFQKIELQPNETKTVIFELDASAFDYWNTSIHAFAIDAGDYTVSVAKNVSDVVLSETVTLSGTPDVETPDYRESAPEYYDLSTGWVARDIPAASFEAIYGRKPDLTHEVKPFSPNTILSEVAGGKIVDIFRFFIDHMPESEENIGMKLGYVMMPDLPLKFMRIGGLSNQAIQILADLLELKPVRAIKRITKK